jgi:PAS domain S-box-containing protein
MTDDTRHNSVTEIDDIVAAQIFSTSDVAFVLTNPRLNDNPVVYVNTAFERLTGYSKSMTIGRNCRFLQCEDTNKDDVKAIAKAIKSNRDIAITLLNQRANGERFYNGLIISPIFSEGGTGDGTPDYFIGMQREVQQNRMADQLVEFETAISEVQHRVKNHLSMILGLIRMKSRELEGNDELGDISRRIESLHILYDEMSSAQQFRNEDTIQLGAFLSRIASAISHLDGRAGVRVNVDVVPILMETNKAARIGLIVSEILTNCMQHAFTGRETGLVELRVSQLDRGGLRITISDDGVGLPDDLDWPSEGSLGARIVTGLCKGVNSKLEVVRGATGTVFIFDVPQTEVQA